MAEKEKPIPPFYYDSRGKGYWLQIPSGGFLQLGSGDIALHLRHAGLFAGKVDTGLNPCELQLLKAQTERVVDYAGPLGGHRIGLYVTKSKERILVTSEPRPEVFQPPIKKAKKCPFIMGFLNQLLGKAQTPIALFWLKCAVESLASGDFRPGQFVALAGPSQCGKSFFHVLVTQLLGGRASKPFKYMSGKTEFNEQLAEAEHLYIEDETANTNTSARRDFGNQIKQMTVNEEFPIHGKGKKLKTLPTFRRLTGSFNDEAENVAIIPPLDSSLTDKIILFKCSVATLSESRPENIRRLMAELPHFRAMLYALNIPEQYRDSRFGCVAYHHPELVEALNELDPQTRLLNLIDEIVFTKEDSKTKELLQIWEGTADALERELLASTFHHAVSNLLRFSSACGVYLARLSKKPDSRVTRSINRGKPHYTIKK